MADLEGLRFVVESKAESSSKGIEELANSFKALKHSLAGNNNIASKMEKLSESLSAINKNASSQTITQLAQAMDTLSKVKISPTIGKNLESITSSVTNLKSADVSKIKELASALKDVSDAVATQAKATSTAASAKAAETVSENDMVNGDRNMVDNAEGIKTATSNITSLSGSIKNALGNIFTLDNVVRSIGDGFKAAGHGAKSLASTIGSRLASQVKAVTGRFGGLFNSLKRIAMYRMIRAMFSQLSNAIRVGTNNIYQYSTAMGGTFKGTLDGLASSFQYLKNSMGSVAAPLLTVLAPAIDTIINKVTTLLNLLAQLFARLTGATHYTAAKKASAQYASAAGAASGAAQELKKSIMSFDEIHKLDDPNSGSGGGGGGGGSDYGSMFEELPIDSAISQFADQIKAAFEAEDWLGLGAILGNKVNEIVDAVDWPGIGEYLGKKVNMVFETGLGFLRTFDGFKFGGDLGQTFKSFLDTVHWDSVAAYLVRKITTVADTCFGFVTTEGIGKSIGTAISDFILGGFNELTEWIDNTPWDDIKEKFGKEFEDCLTSIDFAGIADSIWKALKEAMLKMPSFQKGFIETMFGQMKDGGYSFTTGGILKWLGNDFLKNFIPGYGEDKKTSEIEVGVSIKKGSVWDIDAFGAIKTKAETISRKVKQAVSKGSWDETAWGGVKTKAETVSRIVKQAVSKGNWSSDAWSATKTAANTVKRYLYQNVSKGTWYSEAWDAARAAGGKVTKTLEISVKWLGSKLTEAWKVITGRASGGVLSVSGSWSNIPQYASGTAKAHGSMFIAGESGAEVVGHLNGHTEVLNRSQMAATMYSAMVAGMKEYARYLDGIRQTIVSVANQSMTAFDGIANEMSERYEAVMMNYAMSTPSVPAFAEADTNAIIMGVSEGVAEANLRQNELLREQNSILRELLEKEITAEVSTTSLNKALNRQNLRNGRVGTPALA